MEKGNVALERATRPGARRAPCGGAQFMQRADGGEKDAALRGHGHFAA